MRRNSNRFLFAFLICSPLTRLNPGVMPMGLKPHWDSDIFKEHDKEHEK